MSSVDEEWSIILEAVGEITPAKEEKIKAYFLERARERQRRQKSKKDWEQLLSQIEQALADFD